MTVRSEIRTVPWDADEMYALVADVERYPEFLPWCSAARIDRSWKESLLEVALVDLVISIKGFKVDYRSRVVLDRFNLQIDITNVDGPFRRLQSGWKFDGLSDGCGCVVHFFIEYEFKSAVLKRLMGLMFNQAMTRITQAFERRAEEIYGPRMIP